MICKKCGAYNPDHATFCKVCAANLKEQPDVGEEKVVEAEEVVEEELRPKRGHVKAPDFAAARRAGTFAAAQKEEEPDKEEDRDEEPLEEEEEKPARQASGFARPTAPVKKRRVVDEDEEEEEDEDEDEEEEDEEEEAEKLESEPKTTRFARTSGKKRPVVEEDDDDEDEDDDEDDEDDDDYDDEDDYEEYEPTPPRRKKSSRSQSKSSEGSGFSIVTVLIVCLLAILLIIVGIVAFCNIKGGATKAKLPSVLLFNCAGKSAPEKTSVQPQQQLTETTEAPVEDEPITPTDAPVTGTQVDYSVTKLEELVDAEGKPCISISMTSRPGDTVTIVLPNQDDYVVQNNESGDVPYLLTIPKSCYFPNTPLEDSVYTVTPQVLVSHADGTQESLEVDSFDITFPTLQLELVEPAPASIPEEGIMASDGNVLAIKGKVDDHTVTVTVNGQPVSSMYEGGNFEYTYQMTDEEAEVVTIEATKANCVSTRYEFTVTPYIFVPEQMTLTVEGAVNTLRADKNNKVTVTGLTSPGATLTATPGAEYQTSVACGSPVVDAEGKYSFDVTFDKSYYGIASITIHAKKDGYEEGEVTCSVSRMYADRKSAIAGYKKTNSYHEVPNYAFDKVMADPSAFGLFRFQGKIVSVDPETGIITYAARTSAKETLNIYVLNAVTNWDPNKYVDKSVKLYTTLNGLYTDGTSLYVTAWFQLAG